MNVSFGQGEKAKDNFIYIDIALKKNTEQTLMFIQCRQTGFWGYLGWIF